jgi:uncharacterized protein (TIGR03089 family)
MTPDVARAAPELITYYDDATGERTGLTAAGLGDRTAATAALLTRECGLGPGARAAVLLPPHWLTAVVLLACWSAGIEVSFRGWSTAGLTPAGEPLDVTVVDEHRIGHWLDDVPPAGHRFAVRRDPARPVPAGYRDLESSIGRWRGAAPPPGDVDPRARATVDGASFGGYAAVAREVAGRYGIGSDDRVLVDAATSEQPLIWLLAPLIAGASIVLCAGLDPARRDDRAAAERVTRVLG